VTTATSLHSAIQVLAVNPLDAKSLLDWAGSWALWIVIFAETGLLIGFFLPGDTALFLAGILSTPLAATAGGTEAPHLSFVPLLIVTPIAAILGAQTGYLLGARYGVKLFDRPNSRLFKKEYVDKTEAVFERFGGAKAVVLARFIPVVRTFLNPAAAILRMPPGRFLIFNIIGAILWTDSILIVGHVFAKQIVQRIGYSNLDHYILIVVVVVVLIAALPVIIDLVRKRRRQSRGTDEKSELTGAGRGGSHRAR
jgi:membrane-associated protein